MLHNIEQLMGDLLRFVDTRMASAEFFFSKENGTFNLNVFPLYDDVCGLEISADPNYFDVNIGGLVYEGDISHETIDFQDVFFAVGSGNVRIIEGTLFGFKVYRSATVTDDENKTIFSTTWRYIPVPNYFSVKRQYQYRRFLSDEFFSK